MAKVSRKALHQAKAKEPETEGYRILKHAYKQGRKAVRRVVLRSR